MKNSLGKIIAITFLTSSSLAFADSKTILSDGYFGCIDENKFKKIVTYVSQGDREAFKQSLGTEILSGKCTMFSKGEEVFLVDVAMLSGMVKIRRKGDTTEYWTNREATD